MGKKSRRSNRKDRSPGRGSNLSPIGRRLLELGKEASESKKNMSWSEAINKHQEGLEIVQQLQDAFFNNLWPIDSEFFEIKVSFYLDLIILEYNRCRFDKVIQLYNDIQMSAENEKAVLSFMCKLHGRLAMLRLDASNENKNKVVSLIDTRVSEGMTDPTEVEKALEAVRLLRNMKEYESAIDLGEKMERLSKNRYLNSIQFVGLIGDVGDICMFENAVTHLEQYRVGYQVQTGKVSREKSLHRVLEAYIKIGGLPKKASGPRFDAFCMMIAQRDYLCHQVDDKQQSSQLCNYAIKHVEAYLEKVWHYERHCFTCLQKGTATEVQLVCSGCRVACYCSLDHQRMTWKKEAIQGMRIGHEILCPLMKAYRKWKLVNKKRNERALKLRRRFDRECLYFLSHGLGLKDKCLQERDVQKFLSLQNISK